MNKLGLDAIRDCFEGVVPCIMATSDIDGVPNVSMVSQIHYVDPFRIALSYQFFNKTRRNVLATRTASIVVFDPVSMAQYRMLLDYEETQTSGPIFESMKAKLAGIASHTGMHGIFRLLGSDLYRVRAIETISEKKRPVPAPERNLLAATRLTCAELANCRDLDELCERTLACLQQHLGIEHAIVLMIDEASQQLYTVASRGYSLSGIGSEVPLGDGVIGAAAREGVPVRINHMSADYSYGAAIRDRAQSSGFDWTAATEIPFPGLSEPESQIAVPIIRCGRTIGVLFAESQDALCFGYDDQDALAIVADNFGTTFALLEMYEGPATPMAAPVPETAARENLTVRYYPADNSVFIDGDYLIKGVAGAVFWKLVREYVYENRCEFTNRELRLDPVLRLPAFAENLEARLVLLYRRLAEKSTEIRIEKIGRGRFCLIADRALALEEISDDMRRRAAG
ncbi:GAF domain-containing protein [Rhizobium sp. LjRoot254]|uniref:GAF domain-containing protein n=1 Tax=Rhizobium sp. LjRoot254 TaxID=3342297 RepID=UPI003ED08A0D